MDPVESKVSLNVFFRFVALEKKNKSLVALAFKQRAAQSALSLAFVVKKTHTGNSPSNLEFPRRETLLLETAIAVMRYDLYSQVSVSSIRN